MRWERCWNGKPGLNGDGMGNEVERRRVMGREGCQNRRGVEMGGELYWDGKVGLNEDGTGMEVEGGNLMGRKGGQN